MYGDHEISEGEHDLWFQSLATDPAKRYWMIEADHDPLGVVYVFAIDRRNNRASWGFYIGDTESRHAGIGYFVEVFILSYIFDHLRLNKLCCEIFADNEAVWRMHEKCGFAIEGRLRAHIRKSGTYRDVVSMGMMAAEWHTRREEHVRRIEKRGQKLPNFAELD